MGYSLKKGANAEKISIKVNPISDSNFVKRPYPQNGFKSCVHDKRKDEP